MGSRLQRSISRSLRTILAELPKGASIPESERLLDVMSELEFFLPAVLRVKHAEWTQESLDGVWPLVARKMGEGEVEILGLCMIISNQQYTPLHLRLQIDDAKDEVSWLECSLGERGPHGMETTSYRFLMPLKERLYALDGRAELIDWAYGGTFGHRRP